MWRPLLFPYWVNFFLCHPMYDQLLLLNYNGMIFLHFYFSSIISSLLLVLNYVSVSFLKVMSVLKELFAWMLIQVKFGFSISISMFDILKFFDSPLLTCEWTVKHLLFLEMNKFCYSLFLYWQYKHHNYLF